MARKQGERTNLTNFYLTEEDFFVTKRGVAFSKLEKGLTRLQKNILALAYERSLEKEDLSFGEILISLYGAKPKRIGPLRVQNLSLSELLGVCRSKDYDDFYFSNEAEQDGYRVNQESVFEAVAGMVERGLIIKIRNPKLIWEEDKPRVKRIEYYEMIRLAEKGKALLAEKRRHLRNPLNLPIEFCLI